MYVGCRKQTATEKPVQNVKSWNTTSKLSRVKRCKQCVHSNATANCYNHRTKSKLSACKVNNNELVLGKKFTPLYCDEITDGDDSKHDAHKHDKLQCQSKVRCSVAFRNKTKFSRKYWTNIPYTNTRHIKTKKTINTDNPCFQIHTAFRVSVHSNTASHASRRRVKLIADTLVKNFHAVFVFNILPRFLDGLKLSVSEPLVQRLLLKYGINIRRTNTVNVTETITTLNNSDTLLNCALKLLLIKTQPSDATFVRVIHESGKYHLNYNTLYGAYFMSSIDKNALSNICVNKFDIDLLLLCGDVESNPGDTISI